ncbi:MAG TPA: SH3 domain-containing protein, partial [Phototrophicaceae bacterium]|nr:SH3 domain-containing protein [Phototrophicaceae bacterium]
MKSRSFLLILFALFALTLTFSSSAQLADLQSSTRTAVNLRAGPGVEWRLVGVANPGTTIRLDGQAYGGSWVRGITSTGIVGWMLTDYLNLAPDQAASLRQIWVEEPFNLTAPAQVDGDIGPGSASFTVNTVVNLRSGPGTQWRLVGDVNPGEAFNVDGRSYGGNWVRGINIRSQVGWVFAEYVNGNVLGLPIVDVDTPFGLAAPTGGAAAPTTPTTPDVPAAPPVGNTAP